MSKSKNVVVTGASGGIGAELAELLCAQGNRVAIVARRPDQLLDVARQCGSLALPIVADVTSRETVADVVDEVVENFGHIDVWVNNVGRGITKLATDVTDDDIDEMMRINVKTAIYGMQEVLPHFRERGEGHIINVSSMLGRVPSVPMRSVYSASKHFLNSFTANFRDSVRKTHPGIHVSLVSPGIVATEFGVNALGGGPDSRTLPTAQDVREVAEVIARVIETRAEDVYTFDGAAERVREYFAGRG